MPLAGLLLRHLLLTWAPISSPALGSSGILKREAKQLHLPFYSPPSTTIHTLTTAKGVRTMGTLLLNARPGRQHPTSAPKIAKQNAYYLPARMTRQAKRELI